MDHPVDVSNIKYYAQNLELKQTTSVSF